MDGLVSAIKASGLDGMQLFSLLRGIGDAGGGADALDQFLSFVEDPDFLMRSNRQDQRSSMIAQVRAELEQWQEGRNTQQQGVDGAADGGMEESEMVANAGLVKELEDAKRSKYLAEVDVAETTAR